MKPLLWKYALNPSQSGFSFERTVRKELSAALKAREHSDATYIDLGCGHKPFAYIFNAYKGKYIGMDVYPGKSVDVLYDGKVIPLEDKSVDVLFASSVFEHVENLAGLMKEIGRVLKPHGILVAVTPSTNHVHGVPFDYHRPTRFGWQSLIENSFETTSIAVHTVDNRLMCLANMTTAIMSVTLLRVMKKVRQCVTRTGPDVRALENGDSSPELRTNTGLRIAYLIAELNPLSIIIGWLGFLLGGWRYKQKSAEGELTSGYAVIAVKE